jgi:membrane protein
MMAAIRVALTSVWGAERRQAWRGKTFDLVLVLLAGVLLLVGFALTLVVRLVEDMGAEVGGALGLEQLGASAGDAVQVVLSTASSSPSPCSSTATSRPSLADLWAPALLVAIAIQLTEVAYGFYLARFADYNLVYGSLGAAIGFLFLVYLGAAIFLFGAQLAATWPRVGLSTGARPR